jgi:hypothetical protein
MALTISGVPDQRQYLGQSATQRVWVLAPGTSDYVTGGYIITAAMVDLLKITGGWIIGQNAAAVTAGYLWAFTLAQTSPPIAGLAQIALQALGVTTGTPGVLADAASAFNFTGVVLTAILLGY